MWEIATDIMGSFLGSAYLDANKLIALEFDDGTITTTGVPIIQRGAVQITDIKQRLVNIINQCPAFYAYNYASGVFDYETDTVLDAGSQGIFGTRNPNETMQLYWVRDLSSVQVLQGIVVDKFARPIYEIEFETFGMETIGLDLGDIFAMTVDSLYDATGSPLYNQYWKVVSVNPNFKRGSIRFRALQTTSYMTSAGSRDATIY
jgi:hypothetical protein